MAKLFLYKLLIYTAISCVALALVYYPGLHGGFVFDDISNILIPAEIRINELSFDSIKSAALSMENRPISRASYGLNYFFTGFNPFFFKVVNLIIHTINAILVFITVLLIIKHQVTSRKHDKYNNRILFFLAAAVALGWALHPVNVTNVLYIVQRMNSLSALFVLAGMLSYIKGRAILVNSTLSGWILMTISIIIFLPLAWFSKENGVLLLAFIFIIELTIFHFRIENKKQRHALYIFHLILVLIPVLLSIVYISFHMDNFQAGYDIRHFNMIERLMTEPRILWLYIRMIILPVPSIFGLFHDDIPVSTSLLDPASTLPAAAGLLILFTISIVAIKRAPVLSFGLLFFFAGHLLESGFIPLELAFEHRNYLPSIGILLPMFYYIVHAFDPDKYQKARVVSIICILLYFSFLTNLRAWTWSNNEQLYLTEVQFHPNSPRANYEAGKIYGQRLENQQGDTNINYRKAVDHFEQVTKLRNNTTSGLFGIIIASIDSGHETKPAWHKELEQRLKYQPLEQVNLRWLDRLTDCISQRRCQKQDIQIPKLANAAISNQHAGNANKAMLSSILAKYAYQVENDEEETIKMARNAVSFSPSNLYYRLNLAKYLVWANDDNEARKAIKILKKLDINYQYRFEINTLEKVQATNKR